MLKGNYAWIEEGAILHDEGPAVPPSRGSAAAGTTDKRGELSGERGATQVGAGA